MHFVQFPNLEGEFGTWDKDANGWISAQTFADATAKVGATPIITMEPFSHAQNVFGLEAGQQKPMKRPKRSRRARAIGASRFSFGSRTR